MICPVTGGLFTHDLWCIDLVCVDLFVIGLIGTSILCKALRSGMICPVTGGSFAYDLWYIELICMSVLFDHQPCVGLVCMSTLVVQLGRQYAVEDTSEIVGLVWALSRYSRHQACTLRRFGVVSIRGNIIDIQRGVRNVQLVFNMDWSAPICLGHELQPIMSTECAVS